MTVKTNIEKEANYGNFCELFGVNPRNIILEFFLEMRDLDFAISDVAEETGLNRATTYNTIEELIEKKYFVPTRKIAGAQLYKLNKEKSEVKLLIKIFNLVLDKTLEKSAKKVVN
ncbi:MAG: hypothetical protein Q8R00_02565 [Candidatus Nanoarchaeia archaeon]|nr:hypothetical protein [Candidatus Nanoarchaeia archaeon]